MGSLGQEVLAVAESQLGVAESPDGSNSGPQVDKYTGIYGSWAWNAPWCGSFAGWCYEQVRAGGKQYSDPSTQTICDAKPHLSPQPGALLVQCGVHVVILAEHLGGSSWRCIGGNESNAVRWSTRDLSWGQVRGAPWVGEGAAAPTTTWYFLQDVGGARKAGQRMYYGGWAQKSKRDDAYESLRTSLGHELRRFADPDFDGEYLIDNSAYVTEIYGGWSAKGARDDARATLEDRLGRDLRPFSEKRDKAQGGVPWNCRNLVDPFA